MGHFFNHKAFSRREGQYAWNIPHNFYRVERTPPLLFFQTFNLISDSKISDQRWVPSACPLKRDLWLHEITFITARLDLTSQEREKRSIQR